MRRRGDKSALVDCWQKRRIKRGLLQMTAPVWKDYMTMLRSNEGEGPLPTSNATLTEALRCARRRNHPAGPEAAGSALRKEWWILVVVNQ